MVTKIAVSSTPPSSPKKGQIKHNRWTQAKLLHSNLASSAGGDDIWDTTNAKAEQMAEHAARHQGKAGIE